VRWCARDDPNQQCYSNLLSQNGFDGGDALVLPVGKRKARLSRECLGWKIESEQCECQLRREHSEEPNRTNRVANVKREPSSCTGETSASGTGTGRTRIQISSRPA
jgi:hypothetical protein